MGHWEKLVVLLGRAARHSRRLAMLSTLLVAASMNLLVSVVVEDKPSDPHRTAGLYLALAYFLIAAIFTFMAEGELSKLEAFLLRSDGGGAGVNTSQSADDRLSDGLRNKADSFGVPLVAAGVYTTLGVALVVLLLWWY